MSNTNTAITFPVLQDGVIPASVFDDAQSEARENAMILRAAAQRLEKAFEGHDDDEDPFSIIGAFAAAKKAVADIEEFVGAALPATL